MHIDKGDYVCTVIIDLRKGLDTVDHKILIYYVICGISNKWFQSYLANCQQFVSLNNSKSSQLRVLYGV